MSESHHVTRSRLHVTPYGSVRTSITLTEDGKTLDCDMTAEPEHVLSGWCWCQPLVEYDLASDGQLFIHRRSLDSPHIEPPA